MIEISLQGAVKWTLAILGVMTLVLACLIGAAYVVYIWHWSDSDYSGLSLVPQILYVLGCLGLFMDAIWTVAVIGAALGGVWDKNPTIRIGRKPKPEPAAWTVREK